MTMSDLGPRDTCPDCGQIRGYFHHLPGKCAPPAVRQPLRAVPDAPIDSERASRYAHKALTSECENVAAAAEGTRNHTLNKAAFNLSQLVASGHLGEIATRDALTSAARSAGLDEHEIGATINSGFKAGAERPRVVPEHTVEAAPAITVLDDDADDDTDPLARFNLIDWPTLKRDDDPEEEWLAEPLIAAGRMTALYSAPKAGKSLLVLEVVAAIALGTSALGRPPQAPAKVLYIDFENDPRGDIKPRLEDMGYDLDDLQGNLYVATFPSLARLDTPQGGHELAWLAAHLGAAVVVIDTVSRTVGGEENDNNTWLNFYRNTGVALKRAGVACLRLDHSGKDREKGMRGGSAKYGDVDMVWRLVAASETVIELDCTDHRMPLHTTSLVLVRHTDPLRHEVSGDPFAVAMDAREQELSNTLDRLQVPSNWGRDRVRKALSDAGIKVENTLLGRVIKARKLILPDLSGTGRGQVRTADPVSACPPTPVGGRTADRSEPVRGGQDSTLLDDPDELASCKSCFRPTSAAIADRNGGLCATCHRDTGQATTAITQEETR